DGLALNDHWKRTREVLRLVDERVWADPVLRWLSARHLLWLAVDLAAVGGVGGMLRDRRGRRTGAVLGLLLLPPGDDASFLLTTASYQFRYMYPARVLVQVFAVALGLAAARRKLAEWARAVPA